MGLTILAGMAAAAVQAASPAPPATPQTAPADAVQTIVVQSGKAPVLGDLQKGVLNFAPTFFTQVRPGTAMDMVQWLPGFSFTDTRDMRGLEGSGGNVLIDGKPPTSKTDTLQSVLKRIPANQVERVDIIVGGAPGIDMHGWPVIANVILKKSATRRGFVSASALTDIHGAVTPKAILSNSHNEDGRLLEYNIEVGTNRAISPVFGYGPWIRRGPDGAPLIDANAKVVAGGPYATLTGAWGRPVGGGSFKLNGSVRYYGTDIDETDTVVPGASAATPGDYLFNHTQAYIQAEFGAAYERPMGKDLTLNTQLLERPTHFNADNLSTRPPTPSDLTTNQNSNETVLRTTARYKASDKLTLESAAEGSLNSTVVHNRATIDDLPFALPDASAHVREQRGEVSETVSWKPGPKTSLDAALKLESSTFQGQTDTQLDNTFTYLKPRVVFTWSPNKDVQLRGRVEHEVGQLNFGWFTAGSNITSGEIIAGNIDMKPQRDWVGEVTLERRFWTGGDLSLTLRHLEYQDVFDFAPAFLVGGGVISQNANIGDGWENDVVLNLTLPFKRFGWDGAILKGTLTYGRSQVTDPATGLPRRLINKPEFAGELHFAQDLPDLKLNTGFDAFYTSPTKFFLPLGNQRQGPGARIAVFAEYRATPRLNLRVEVQNLPGTRATVSNDAFAGLRGQSPLLYTDVKHLAVGPLLFLQVRRTFE